MKPPTQRGNLFAGTNTQASGEDFLTLLETAGARVERIVSRSHSSPPGFWYDQDEDEWVMLVRGTAALEFDGGEIVAIALPAPARMPSGWPCTSSKNRVHRSSSMSDSTIGSGCEDQSILGNALGLPSRL